MNYHFFGWDDKFIDGFIKLADEVSSNNTYIFNFAPPVKYVKSNKGIFAPNNSAELESIIQEIGTTDKVLFHPWSVGSDIFLKLPAETEIYAIFWGGEFLNIGPAAGVKNVFGDLLYEPLTKELVRKNAHIERTSYVINHIKFNLLKKNSEGLLNVLKSPMLYYRFFDNNLQKYINSRKKFLERVTAICHWNRFDIELLENLFQTKITQKKFFYGTGRNWLNSEEKSTVSKPESEPLIFFVGNSDTPTNNHLDTFEILKRFKHENILIYAPLSYQNGEYARYISEVGKKIFGEKFIPIFDFLPKDQYLNLIDKMDVCVMNHRRTQAGGNIMAFLSKGKKVFINPNSTLYLFLKSMRIEVYSINSLNSLNIDELRTGQSSEIVKKNIEILRNEFGAEEATKRYCELLVPESC